MLHVQIHGMMISCTRKRNLPVVSVKQMLSDCESDCGYMLTIAMNNVIAMGVVDCFNYYSS